jgi:4-carboxymuconolactone decarboxylase
MDGHDPDDILGTVRAKRGYLLAYHRLLAAHDPALLRRYDDWYDALTLAPRALGAADREIVWVALVAVTERTVGALHLKRGREAGLSDEAIRSAIALASLAAGYRIFVQAAEGWPDFAPAETLDARHLALFETARADLPRGPACLAMATAMAGLENWPGFSLYLRHAFDAGVTVTESAEAMSFLIHHCGGPTLVAASEAWFRLAEAGSVPSPFEIEDPR